MKGGQALPGKARARSLEVRKMCNKTSKEGYHAVRVKLGIVDLAATRSVWRKIEALTTEAQGSSNIRLHCEAAVLVAFQLAQLQKLLLS
jgi:hypothetical protein